MLKKTLAFHILFVISFCSYSQGIAIGANTPDASAILDITAASKGLLIPRMNTMSINAINNPARGLLVYDSTANQLMVNTGTPVIPNWQPVATGNSIAWKLNGNNNINPINQFVGTTDNQPLRFRINNIKAGELHPESGNIFWGLRAGQANTSGFSNIAIGTDALKFDTEGSNLVAIGDSALFNNGRNNPAPGTLGFSNTAIGSKSLFSNSIGNANTATGTNSLFFNIDGSSNTAYGVASLFSNTSGGINTAIGGDALFSNTTGNVNTAVGYQSLFSNTTAFGNTAAGYSTLHSNTTGIDNVAIGFAALSFNTTADSNTAVGQRALLFNTVGRLNIAAGSAALFLNTTGSNNTATGSEALYFNTTGFQNTAVGSFSLLTNDIGSSNTAIGFGADVSTGNLTNASAIGQGAIVNASNKIRLGNSAVTVIEGQVPFTTPSDGRFKYQVKEDVKGLDFIMQLRPVTYQFDVKRFDEQQNNDKPSVAFNNIIQAAYNKASAIRRTGFIAQEVEKAADASGYDFSGIIKPKTEQDHYSLSYESFVVPLVKAVQEQQKMITAQQQLIEEIKKQNADLQKRMTALEKKK